MWQSKDFKQWHLLKMVSFFKQVLRGCLVLFALVSVASASALNQERPEGDAGNLTPEL